MGRKKGGRIMRRIIRWTAVLLAAILLLGLYHVLRPKEAEPQGTSGAALGLMLLEKGGGLYVLAVTQDSPADKAGFLPGDTILLPGDDTVTALEELLSDQTEPVPITLRRDGRELQLIFPAR